jgi:ABC transport system ATP-binding/permease protein
VAGPRKLSYREQQELQRLPERIEELEAEQQRLTTAVGSVDFYKESGETIRQTLARLDALQGEVLDAYARWNELDSRTKR